MEIVKGAGGLFERYTEELQIQTLFLLSRGNLEVTSQMKYHIDKWGRDTAKKSGPRRSTTTSPPCSSA